LPTPRLEITVRELILAAAGACLLAVIMHWPLALHLGQDVPRDLGDPLAQAWQVAWGGNALLEQPSRFFQSNQFWPLPDTLAFSDALAGYSPAGMLGSGSEAAIARYDLLFLFSYALAFLGSYLLARELGVGPMAAAVAGAAYAFAPFRLEQDGHLHIISSGGIPLALALGVRAVRLRRWTWMLAAWAVATWQLALGFSLGIPFAYLLAALGVVALVVWLSAGRPRIERRLAAAAIVGAVAFLAAGVLLSRPYERVADAHPEARRSPSVVEEFSGPPTVFAVAPAENLIWGPITAPLRDTLSNVPEKTLFPGLAILVLAWFGARSPIYPRGLRIGLVVAVAAISVLALGFLVDGGLLFPYRVIYEYLPGWEAIRVPGRLVTFSSIGLALLAAAGAQRLLSRAQTREPRWLRPPALAALLVVVVVVEGRGLPFDPFDDQAQPRAPEPPAALASADPPPPQLHLPALRPEDNRRYLLWSTDGFPPIVNGRSSLAPTFTENLLDRSRGFPDRASAELLQHVGVRSVVLHVDRIAGTPWERAPERPIAGLPLVRLDSGELTVYEIDAVVADSPAQSSIPRPSPPAR